MRQDDGPVGLDGVQIEFDDEGVALGAGGRAGGNACPAAGERAVRAGIWCGCKVTDRARPMRGAR